MDEEKILHEIEEVQKSLANTEPTSDEYKTLIERLKSLNELLRIERGEDPETIKARAEEAKVQTDADLRLAEMDSKEKIADDDRKHSKMMLIAKGIGIAALMMFSACLTVNEIPSRIDEKFIDTFGKSKD